MDGKNPCDVCTAKDKASGCSGCALDYSSMQYECANDECMLNYECGCLVGLDEVCKASNCYQDDLWNHDCDECAHIQEGEDGIYMCDRTGEEVGHFDCACDEFKERENG